MHDARTHPSPPGSTHSGETDQPDSSPPGLPSAAARRPSTDDKASNGAAAAVTKEGGWAHAARVLPSILMRHGITHDEAMDVAQGMICKLLLDLRVAPTRCTNPVGILAYRAQHAASSWKRWRAQRREDVLPEERLVELESSGHAVVGCTGPVKEPTTDEVRTALRETWPVLTRRELDLLVLRHVHGLPAREVATAWGWSLDQVKRAYARIGRILHFGEGYKRP